MYLLFDIGGTNMRLAVSKNGESVDDMEVIPTPQGFEEAIQKFKDVAAELSKNEKITKIAGGIAGSLDKTKSMLVASPHLGRWINKPLKSQLEQIFEVKVALENDAMLSGLGEAVYGIGKDYSIVGFIGIGTGLGGAKIVNGKIDENSLGFEPGHQVIEMNGKLCHCGGRGHLESYVAGGYFKENYGVEGVNLTGEMKKEICRYLAAGLNNTVVHWSPDVVVLGGSVIDNLEIQTIQEYFDEALTIFNHASDFSVSIPNHSSPVEAGDVGSHVKLLKNSLEDKAGLFGALALIK